MNINNIMSDFTNNISSVYLSHSEEEFITKSYNTMRKLNDNSLFHVVKDALIKDIQHDNGQGLTLGSFQIVLARIKTKMNLDPETTKKVEKVFLEQFLQHHWMDLGLPATIDASTTNNLLAYMFKENPEKLFVREFNAVLNTLSMQSQLQFATLMAKKSSNSAQSINFYHLNKINEGPIETRLELAKMIASHGQKATEHLCAYQLPALNLQNASLDQKMDLAACILQHGKNSNDLHDMFEGLLKLQPKEPKEQYLTYLKALIKKFIIEPKGLDINIVKLTQKEVPREEKLLLAKKIASLGKLADQYLAALMPEILDVELAILVAKQKGEVYYALLEHLSTLPLKNTPVNERLELAKVIFDHYRDGRNERYLFKIIEELVSPGDSVESRIEFAQTILKGWQILFPDRGFEDSSRYQGRKVLEAIFKNLPNEGVPLSELADLIKKNTTKSQFVIKYFNFMKCGASNKDIFDLAPIIMDQGKALTSLLAKNLDKFGIQSVPFQSRIDTLQKILQISPDSGRDVAENLRSIISDAPIQDRLRLAKTLVQMGDSVASMIAYESKFLKLEEATLQERLELAFLIAQQGNRNRTEPYSRSSSAWGLESNLKHFFLKQAPLNEQLRLAELLAKQGQALTESGLEELNFKNFSKDQRISLATQMINYNTQYYFEKDWLAGLPWEDQIQLAKLALKTWKDSGREGSFPLDSWKFHAVPFSELYSLTELLMQQEKIPAHFQPLKLFGHSLKGTELISLLSLFSRQSTDLLKQMVLELKSPPLSVAAYRQAMMEFLIDNPLDLQMIYSHPALQEVKPLLNLLTLKTLDVQEEVNQTNSLPKDVITAKLQLKQFLESKEEFKTLRRFYSKIEEIDNPMLQFKLMRWLAYTAGKFTDVHANFLEVIVDQFKKIFPTLIPSTGVTNEEKLKAIEEAKMIDEIFDHQSLPDRFVLVRELSHMNEPFQPRVVEQEDGKLKEFNEYGKLSWILLSRLKSLGIANEQLENINDLIDGKKGFKTTKNFSVLVELLNEVLLLPPLQAAEAKLFTDRLEAILRLKTMDEVLLNLQGLTNILILLGRDNFIKALTEKDINAFFFKEFEKHISLGKIDDFARKWQKTFGKSRYPNAIFSYLKSLEKLPLEEREIAKQAMGRYIQSVLNGDFPAVRYNTENQPHLAQVFAIEDMKKHWLDKGKPVEVGKYTLSFSEDFMDLLLIGTEIQGSCQHIVHDPLTNKCLISYLMHGGILPIVARPKRTRRRENGSQMFPSSRVG